MFKYLYTFYISSIHNMGDAFLIEEIMRRFRFILNYTDNLYHYSILDES